MLNQQCTIDEAMIPSKGRLGFKQYMRDRPTKWGIKVWVLADATNGYVKKFEVYTGKEEGNRSSVGLCSRVVLNLMKGLHGSGLHLYTDNFYTSLCCSITCIIVEYMHVEQLTQIESNSPKTW